MSQRQETQFDKFIFTDTELFLLSDLQRQYIRHYMTMAAETRLAMELDPNNISAFIQQEAYLKGKMEFGQQLLDLADSNVAQTQTPGE